MATAPSIAIKAYRSLTGLPIPRESFPEAATQTFKKGALVVLNSAGYLVECGADPPLIMGVATAAGGNGTNAGDKTQVVELAHPDTLFKGNLDDGSSEGTGTTAQTDYGKMYGVYKTSSATNTPWRVDSNEQTNKRVVVWKIDDQVIDGVAPAVGDTIGQVLFSFDPAYFQGQKTS